MYFDFKIPDNSAKNDFHQLTKDQSMSGGASSVDVKIGPGGNQAVEVGSGDDYGEIFPEDRADGSMSGMFKSARRFQRLLGSED